MKKERIPAIEYIRGISMLGVIGIHTGSQYLSNPANNIHLIAGFEIFTRFSVPIFFFISAFGLFYNLDLSQPFRYKDFLRRRFQTVLAPYLVWSFFYIFHYTFLYHDPSLLSIPTILKYLFFGFASYQLYFLVIMLWFYLLMPVWIAITKKMTVPRLGILLLLQIAFDYYSSFIMNPYVLPDSMIKALLMYRLNYWVLHYVFIFILGGYCAIHYEKFQVFMKTKKTSIYTFFVFTLGGMFLYYYSLLFKKGYTTEEAINTAHQLSPIGVLYTLAASIFFFTIFTQYKIPEKLHTLLACLGRHSYFAYLFHPVIITYLSLYLTSHGRIMTSGIAIIFYCLVTSLSITAAALFRKLGLSFPLLNQLTIGTTPKK